MDTVAIIAGLYAQMPTSNVFVLPLLLGLGALILGRLVFVVAQRVLNWNALGQGTSLVLAHARLTNAVLTRVGQAEVARDGHRVNVFLEFQIPLRDGATYRAGSTWLITMPQWAHLRIGQVIAVQVDANDADVIYPNVGWAQYHWGYGKTEPALESHTR